MPTLNDAIAFQALQEAFMERAEQVVAKHHQGWSVNSVSYNQYTQEFTVESWNPRCREMESESYTHEDMFLPEELRQSKIENLIE